MTKTLTVEGDITAADTRSGITSQGSVTAPSLVVPTGVTKIDGIIVAAGADGAAAGGAAFIIRLGGSAVQRGEQVIVVGAAGVTAPQAGSDQAPQAPGITQLADVDIEVVGGEVISIDAEMCGSDLGTAGIVITLVFA